MRERASRRDARNDLVKAVVFLASLRDAIRQWNQSRGFEDSTPGYVLAPLRGDGRGFAARKRQIFIDLPRDLR